MKMDYIMSTLVYKEKFHGVKESLLKSSNIIMIEFTRDVLKNIDKYEKLKNNGIYFLILENKYIYIGQSTNVYSRIFTHNSQDKKDFNKVLAFVSNNNQLSKTFIDYCEWYFINKIKSNQSYYKLSNDAKRDNEPKLNSHDKCEVNLIIESILQLLNFVGIEFEQETTYKDGIFYLDKAKLIFNNGKFKLLQGSKFNKPTKMVADKDGKIYDSYIKFLNDNNESIIFSDNKCILKNDL